jgi:iron(III) transport system permease protein
MIVGWRSLGDAGEQWGRIVEYRLWEQIGSTALLIVLVALFAICIGVVCAWLVSAYEFPGRRTLEWLLILPLGVPAFVAGAAYLDGFEQLTPAFIRIREHLGLEAFLLTQKVLPWIGSVLVLVATLYPYVYMSCRASFSGQQADLIEAARTMGCSPLKAFFRIVLPLARPAIAAGAALVAMETANDYGVVSLFGLNTLTPGVFRAWSEGSLVSAMRLAFILLTLIMFVMVLERAQRGRRGFAGDSRERPLARLSLTRVEATLAWVFCGIPLLLGFGWPVTRFLRWAFDAGEFARWSQYAGALFNSTWLALLASTLVVVTAFWLTAGRRAWRLRGGKTMQYLASLGYAIPSALLAVGIGVLVSDLSGMAGMAWLALSASAVGLLFAYWVRFMAVGIQPVAGAQAGIALDLHSAARTLGASPARALFRVDMRLLKPALLAAAVLCFVDVFKELTLTLVMRPFDFETLATLTFRLSSEGRIPEASLPALGLVAGGMLGVAAMNRMLGNRQ